MEEGEMSSVKAARGGNIAAGALLIAVAGVVFVQMATMQESGSSSDPGASGYPTLLAVILLGLAIMLLFQTGSGDQMPVREGGLRVLGAVVLLVTYYFMLGAFGYIGSTALFLVATLLVMGIRKPLPLVLLPILFSVSLFYLFYTVFGVALPRGFLEGFFS